MGFERETKGALGNGLRTSTPEGRTGQGRNTVASGSSAVLTEAPAHAMVSLGAEMALQRCPVWGQGTGPLYVCTDPSLDGGCPGQAAWPWTLAEGSSWGEVTAESQQRQQPGEDVLQPRSETWAAWLGVRTFLREVGPGPKDS